MFQELNKEQYAAVLAIDGPVIVFAGAGSGKTKTLTSRIAYMIQEKNIYPYNILGITFTNKAANEMRSRLNSYLFEKAKGLTITTFHSLCAKILRIDIEHLGYSRDFTIIDEEDQQKVISDVLKELDYSKKEAKKMQHMINDCKCLDYKPDNPLEEKVFQAYEKRMKELNALDFEDLLIKVKELFMFFPEVLERYQRKYKYILVDEFQDTNLIQYQIVKMLTRTSRNLFVVGDDDQSIYSFRGTNYGNVKLFKHDFPEHKLFLLTENYRSCQSILDGANRLISNNFDRQKKELFSKIEGTPTDVQVYQAVDEKDEVNYVIDNILTLKNSRNEFSDFCILYRSSVLLRNFELGLIRAGIPYKVYGGMSYLRRREVKDIIAYFKLLVNQDDWLSFKRIINVPGRGIGPSTVEKIEIIRRQNKLTTFEAIESSKSILPLSKYKVLCEFRDLILHYTAKLENTELIEIFDELVARIDYIDFLKEEYEKEDVKEKIDNLNEFKSILYQVENSSEELSRLDRLKDAFDNAILSDEYLQNQKENTNGVTVSTIHSIKGLEFNYVFLVGLEENTFPNYFRIKGDSELEEERRIAYVAVTRAKNRLFLTAAKKRMLYGSFYNNNPSIFLLEFLGATKGLDGDYQEAEVIDKIDVKKIEMEKPKITESYGYCISDKVTHNKFGDGIIVSITNDIGQIFFNNEKKLIKIDLSHPALKKK